MQQACSSIQLYFIHLFQTYLTLVKLHDIIFLSIFDIRQITSSPTSLTSTRYPSQRRPAHMNDIIHTPQDLTYLKWSHIRSSSGSYSCFDNLKLIRGNTSLFNHQLKESDRSFLFDSLQGILSNVYLEKIWNMIFERHRILYENL